MLADRFSALLGDGRGGTSRPWPLPDADLCVLERFFAVRDGAGTYLSCSVETVLSYRAAVLYIDGLPLARTNGPTRGYTYTADDCPHPDAAAVLEMLRDTGRGQPGCAFMREPYARLQSTLRRR